MSVWDEHQAPIRCLVDKFCTEIKKGDLILYPQNFPGSQVSEIRVYEVLDFDLRKEKLKVKQRIGSRLEWGGKAEQKPVTLQNYRYAIVINDKLAENIQNNLDVKEPKPWQLFDK